MNVKCEKMRSFDVVAHNGAEDVLGNRWMLWVFGVTTTMLDFYKLSVGTT